MTTPLRVRALDRARTRPGALLVALVAFAAGAITAYLMTRAG